jgi:hypothetical protein
MESKQTVNKIITTSALQYLHKKCLLQLDENVMFILKNGPTVVCVDYKKERTFVEKKILFDYYV